MSGFGTFAAGLFKGIARKKAEERENEKNAPLNKLKEQELKLRLQKAKNEQTLMSMFMNSPYFKNMQANSGETENKPAPSQPNFSDSFTPAQGKTGPGLTDTMASAQMDPMFAAIMKKSTGIDFPGVSRFGETQRHNQHLENTASQNLSERVENNKKLDEDRDARFDFDKKEVVWRKRTVDGVEWEYPYTKHGMPVIGVKPIKISGKKGQSIEGATKSQGMRVAVDGISKVRKMITKKDGTIDKNKLFQLKPIPFINKPVPDFIVSAFSDQPPIGLQMNTLIAQAYESLVRGESGAAVPPEELKRLAERYGIDWLQSDKTVNLRLNQLQKILAGTVKAVDPQDIHKYNPDDLVKRVYPDGREEYVILPDVDGSVPAPMSQLPEGWKIEKVE